jgi:hypothetical protein
LAFWNFHPGEKALDGAFRHRCSGMFSRAPPLRLIEEDDSHTYPQDPNNSLSRCRAMRVDGCQSDAKE